jgi:hypothetical protein
MVSERRGISITPGFPFFRRMWRDSGFTGEADRMAAGGGADSFSDDLLDSFCLIGPIERCQRRLAEYRDAGVDLLSWRRRSDRRRRRP